MNDLVRHIWRSLLVQGLAVALIPAHAASLFVVTEPWVRVASNGRAAEAYMELRSTDGATLVAVKSDIATEVVMRSPGASGAPLSRIPLAAGSTVKLAPGGYRLVLASLDRTLKLGDRVEFVLTIEGADGKRQDIAASAEVRRRSPTDDHRRGHAH